MAGFRYLTSQASAVDRFRQYLSLAGRLRRSKVSRIRVTSGFTGSVAVTGVGWQPEALMLFGGHMLAPDFEDQGILHWGFADGTNQWGGGVFFHYLADSRQGRWSDSLILAAAAGGIEGSLVSFDADGFTLDIDVGPPVDTDLVYMAIRGEGSYHVGTDQVPGSTGTQSITGLGFEPTAIYISSAQRDALSNDGAYARLCHGLGTDDGQWNVWCGSDTGDPFTNSAAQENAVLSLWQDANLAGGVFQPALLAEAELVSFDADGFTLDWTTVDGNPYYFSWFATDEETQAGRWTYNHGDNERGRIRTRRRPKALIFPSGSQAINGSQNQAGSGGATIALGCCDQKGTRGGEQWSLSLQDLDMPSFSIPRASRDLFPVGFGCFNRHSGGSTLTNNQDDRGLVTPFGRDHLLRMHVGP